MPSWITESLLASVPSLVAALIWIIRLGGRLDALEASFSRCQTQRKEFRQRDDEIKEAIQEQVRLDRDLLAEKLEKDRAILAEKLETISGHIGEIKGELKVLVGLLHKGAEQ